MDPKHSFSKYRNRYQKLIRLYRKKHRDRFGEAMIQTFDDLCVENEQNSNSNNLHFMAWVFTDTAFAILKEYLYVTAIAMKNKPAALIGLLLLIPFSSLIAIRTGWQLLHYFEYAGTPHLAGLLLNHTLGYLIFNFGF